VTPADETPAHDNTTGPIAYWKAEGAQLAQSKLALQEKTLRLNKLTVLLPVTEELMEDAPSLNSYLGRVVPNKMHAALNTAIFSGTGSGQPSGIMNAASLVSVAKESGQAADTVVYQNLANIYSRLWAGSMPNAVWLANADILPQLLALAFPDSGTGVTPVWMPPGAAAGEPYGRLFGRPLIFVEPAETLGDKGDLVLVDLSQYLCILKRSGLRSAVSAHLWFDYDTLAYKWVLRVSGLPLWASAVSPENGSVTRSWAVTLDARS
jgi:HK97 family phage major capsid protein